MAAKVYIETSVVSYYTARPSRDVVVAGHQQATHDFWMRFGRDFEPFVSAVVLGEAGKGDAEQAASRLEAIRTFRVFQITEGGAGLGRSDYQRGGIPAEYPEDALHIALAAIGGVDFLVTWNFARINNPFTRMMIRQIIENAGYVCPEIVSPDELLGEDT